MQWPEPKSWRTTRTLLKRLEYTFWSNSNRFVASVEPLLSNTKSHLKFSQWYKFRQLLSELQSNECLHWKHDFGPNIMQWKRKREIFEGKVVRDLKQNQSLVQLICKSLVECISFYTNSDRYLISKFQQNSVKHSIELCFQRLHCYSSVKW